MEPLAIKKKFVELRAQGYSFDKISKEIGVGKQALLDWSKELQDEVANLKAIELDELYQQYHLHKAARLRSFALVLSRIKDELESRDLSTVPTEKLLELYLKYDSQIKEEIVEPVYKSSQELEEAKEDRETLARLTETPQQPSHQLKAG